MLMETLISYCPQTMWLFLMTILTVLTQQPAFTVQFQSTASICLLLALNR
jgi:hypothetical protein